MQVIWLAHSLFYWMMYSFQKQEIFLSFFLFFPNNRRVSSFCHDKLPRMWHLSFSSSGPFLHRREGGTLEKVYKVGKNIYQVLGKLFGRKTEKEAAILGSTFIISSTSKGHFYHAKWRYSADCVEPSNQSSSSCRRIQISKRCQRALHLRIEAEDSSVGERTHRKHERIITFLFWNNYFFVTKRCKTKYILFFSFFRFFFLCNFLPWDNILPPKASWPNNPEAAFLPCFLLSFSIHSDPP